VNRLIPLERENQRVLTTKQLAAVYETNENNIQNNFNNHKSKFKEGKHYFLLRGEELRKFKSEVNDIDLVPKNINQLYIWTERGANRHCKILDTDKAWEQFDNLEETYFRVQQQKPTCIEDVLIQSLQEMKDIKQQLNQVNNNALQANAKAEESKKEVQAIRDVITINPKAAWRRECNRILNAIGNKTGNYKLPKDEVYKALKERGNCRPNVLVNNLKKRAKVNGMAPSKIEKLNILDVLENEPRLKEIYVSIVKDMAIKNRIRV
jgi:hypothetical protein